MTLEVQGVPGADSCSGGGILVSCPNPDSTVLFLENVSIELRGSECSWLRGIHTQGSLMNYVEMANSKIVMEEAPNRYAIDPAFVQLDNVEIIGATLALDPWEGSTIRHSVVQGDISGPNGGAVHLSHSQFSGEVTGGDGLTCFSVHDADLNPLDENCEPIPPPGEDPHAEFSFATDGLTVQFLNQSTGTPPLFHFWNFGDGTTGAAANPAHTYASAATYTVVLTVTNSQGTDTIARSVTVVQ